MISIPEPKQIGHASSSSLRAFPVGTALKDFFACSVGMKIGEVERIIALAFGESSFTDLLKDSAVRTVVATISNRQPYAIFTISYRASIWVW